MVDLKIHAIAGRCPAIPPPYPPQTIYDNGVCRMGVSGGMDFPPPYLSDPQMGPWPYWGYQDAGLGYLEGQAGTWIMGPAIDRSNHKFDTSPYSGKTLLSAKIRIQEYSDWARYMDPESAVLPIVPFRWYYIAGIEDWSDRSNPATDEINTFTVGWLEVPITNLEGINLDGWTYLELAAVDEVTPPIMGTSTDPYNLFYYVGTKAGYDYRVQLVLTFE